MDIEKVGKGIAYLRKRVGFTQKDLADRLGISDKAVSKWERGLGLPDISYFGKLAILLDTDTDSLLAGDVIHHDTGWSGLLILNENQYDIQAGTMLYDKPMVYFLLGYFLLVGIKNICIVCNGIDKKYLESEFGDGDILGLRLYYCSKSIESLQAELNDNITKNNVMVVFGRTLIYGVDQTRFFQRAMTHKDRVTVLSLPKRTMSSPLSIVSFDESKKIVRLNSEERVKTQYDYYDIPVVFCPKFTLAEICEISGNELIINLSLRNSHNNPLYTVVLDRGYIEMRIDDWDDVADASILIRLIQKTCGMNIYCIEEIAWRRGMINLNQLKEFGLQKENTLYGKYILNICKRHMNLIE